jgi:hypothetical protein
MSLDGSLGDGDCSTVIDVRAGVGEIVGTAREHRSAEPVDPAVSFLADTSPNSQPEPGGGNGQADPMCRHCVLSADALKDVPGTHPAARLD